MPTPTQPTRRAQDTGRFRKSNACEMCGCHEHRPVTDYFGRPTLRCVQCSSEVQLVEPPAKAP